MNEHIQGLDKDLVAPYQKISGLIDEYFKLRNLRSFPQIQRKMKQVDEEFYEELKKYAS